MLQKVESDRTSGGRVLAVFGPVSVRYRTKADIRHHRIRPSAGFRYVKLLVCGDGRILIGAE
jgi:hypothetical protein